MLGAGTAGVRESAHSSADLRPIPLCRVVSAGSWIPLDVLSYQAQVELEKTQFELQAKRGEWACLAVGHARPAPFARSQSVSGWNSCLANT